MATYDQLPVYKKTQDLLLAIFHICQNMERDYKYTIGERLKNEILQLQINVFKANCREDKCDLLGLTRENVEVVRLLVRLLHDLKQIKSEVFVNLNVIIESVSKQLTAWQKSSKQLILPSID